MSNAKPKHTPGPWSIGPKYPKGLVSVIHLDETGTFREIAEADTKANATLIAAAPEMLEALVEIGEELDEQGKLDLLSDETRELLARAIVKARGES